MTVNVGYTELSIDIDRQDDRLLVRVSGDLDHDTARALSSQLEPYTQDSVLQIDLDLAGVTFIGSGALQVFIAIHKDLRDKGGTLRIAEASPVVERILELTHLGEVFNS